MVAGALKTIASGLDQYTGDQHIRRYSHGIGLRYDLEQTVSLKVEVERTTDRSLDDSAMTYSLSLDFVY